MMPLSGLKTSITIFSCYQMSQHSFVVAAWYTLSHVTASLLRLLAGRFQCEDASPHLSGPPCFFSFRSNDLLGFISNTERWFSFFQDQNELVYLSTYNAFQSIPFTVLTAALSVHFWATRSHFWLLPRPFDHPVQI